MAQLEGVVIMYASLYIRTDDERMTLENGKYRKAVLIWVREVVWRLPIVPETFIALQ